MPSYTSVIREYFARQLQRHSDNSAAQSPMSPNGIRNTVVVRQLGFARYHARKYGDCNSVATRNALRVMVESGEINQICDGLYEITGP